MELLLTNDNNTAYVKFIENKKFNHNWSKRTYLNDVINNRIQITTKQNTIKELAYFSIEKLQLHKPESFDRLYNIETETNTEIVLNKLIDNASLICKTNKGHTFKIDLSGHLYDVMERITKDYAYLINTSMINNSREGLFSEFLLELIHAIISLFYQENGKEIYNFMMGRSLDAPTELNYNNTLEWLSDNQITLESTIFDELSGELVDTGTISYLLDGEALPADNENSPLVRTIVDGKVSLEYTFPDQINLGGEHTLEVVMNVEGYPEAVEVFDLLNQKYDVDVTLEIPSEIKVDQSINYVGSILDEKGRTITFNDDEKPTVTILENTDNLEVIDGIYHFEHTFNNSNVFDIVVTVPETQKTNSATRTFNVTVDKYDTKFLEVSETDTIILGNNTSITGKLVDEDNKALQNKEITIILDDIEHTVNTDNKGRFSLILTPEQVGTQNILIKYEGDYKYNLSTSSTRLIVEKIGTELLLNEIDDVVVDERIYITGSLLDTKGKGLAQQNIKVNVNNEVISAVTNSIGKFNVPYNVNIVDNFNVSVEFSETESFESSSNETTFNSTKHTSSLFLKNLLDIHMGNSIYIAGSLLDEKEKPVQFEEILLRINDDTQTVTTNNKGVFAYLFTPQSKGEVNVEAVYEGNSKYTESDTNATFIVSTYNTSIVLDEVQDAKVGETVNISGHVFDENNNSINNHEVTLNINDNIVSVNTNTKGVFNYQLVVDEVQQYLIVATVTSNTLYESSETETTFQSTKTGTNITLEEIDPINFDTIITLTGTVTDENNNPLKHVPVILDINDDEPVTVYTDKTGTYEHDYKVVTSTTTVNASLTETETHLPANSTITIQATKLDTNIILAPIESMNVNIPTTITGLLIDANNVPLTNAEISLEIIEDDNIHENILYTNENGRFTYDYTPNESFNNIQLILNYDGDTKYNNTNQETNITNIRKSELEFNIHPIESITYTETVTITGTVKDKNNNNNYNGNLYLVTPDTRGMKRIHVVNGVIDEEYTPNSAGEINISIVKEADSVYDEQTVNATIIVNPIQVKINLDEIEAKEVNKPIDIVATITDINDNILTNQKVTLNIGNDSYELRTDVLGKITKQFLPTRVKDYPISVVINKETNYVNNSKEIVYTPLKRELTINLSEVTDCYVQDERILIGTITDSNNNPVSNITIDITTNDKTVTIETNNDGTFARKLDTNTAGTQTIIVTSIPDGMNNESNATTSFNINKYDSSILINELPETIYELDAITLQATLKGSDEETIKETELLYTINNNETINVNTNKNGIFNDTLIITDQENTITLVFEGNEKYNACDTTITFNADKHESNIILESLQENIKVDDTITLKGKIVDEENNNLGNQNFVLTINEQVIDTFTDNTGKFKYVWTPTNENTYNIKVQTQNIHYNGSTVLETVEVTKQETSITFDESFDKKINERGYLIGKVLTERDQPATDMDVEIFLNDLKIDTTTNELGEFSVPYVIRSADDVQIRIRAIENRVYKPCNKTSYINVSQYDTAFVELTEPLTVEYGSKYNLAARLVDDTNTPIRDATVNAVIDNEDIELTTDEYGRINYEFRVLNTGVINISLSYAGNTRNESCTAETSVTVNKLETSLTLKSILDCKVEDTIYITGYLVDEKERSLSEKEIIITINNETYSTLTNTDGVYSYEYIPSIADDYNVTVAYNGNNIYEESSNTKSFTASKYELRIIDATVSDTLLVDEVLNINGSIVDVTDKYFKDIPLTITINEDSPIELTSANNGSYSYLKSFDNEGGQTITICIPGTNKYDEVTEIIIVDVVKEDTSIMNLTEPFTHRIGERPTITGVLVTENGAVLKDTELTIQCNDTSETVTTDDDGAFTKSFNISTTGTYDIQVTYPGSNRYNSCSDITCITVVKTSSKLSLQAVNDAKVEQTINITGTLLDQDDTPISDASVTLEIHDEENNADTLTLTTNNLGEFSQVFTPNVDGVYVLQAVYDGDEIYSSTNATGSINVSKTVTNISIEELEDCIVEDKVYITGKLVDEFDNPLGATDVVLMINDETFTLTTNIHGRYNYLFKPLTSDIYDISVIFEETNKYVGSVVETSVTASKTSTVLSVNSIDDCKVDDTITIDGHLLCDDNPVVNAEIIIKVDEDTNYTVTTNNNGYYSKAHIIDYADDYEIQVTYNGSNKYIESSESERFTSTQYTSNINIEELPNDIKYNDSINIIGTLTDENNDVIINHPLILTHDEDITEITTDQYGIFNIPITATVGTHTLTIQNNNNNKYLESSETIEYNVRKQEPNFIEIVMPTLKFGETGNITGKLVNENNIAITDAEIIIEENTITTNNNGEFTYELTANNNTPATLTITYNGNNNINSKTETVQTNIGTLQTTLTLNKTQNTLLGNNTIISGTLTDENGNTVKNVGLLLLINERQRIRLETDENGEFRTGVQAPSVGEYTIHVTSDAQGYYLSSEANDEFTVYKHDYTINLSSVIPEQIYHDETINITGTLTDENDETVTNAEIEIIVNDEEPILITTDTNGNINYNLTNLQTNDNIEGYNNNIKIKVSETNTINERINEYNVNVRKASTTLTIQEIQQSTIGSLVTVNALLYDSSRDEVITDQSVTIMITDNTQVTINTDANGIATTTFTPETVKVYEILAMYGGSSSYIGCDTSTEYVPLKGDYILTVDEYDQEIKVGRTQIISGKLTDSEGVGVQGNKITLNSYECTTDNEGNFQFEIVETTSGRKDYVLATEETTNNNSITRNIHYDSLKVESNIVLDIPQSVVPDEAFNITGVLLDEDDNTLSDQRVILSFDDETRTATTNNDGEYTFRNIILNEDTTITVEYIGTSKYTEDSIEQILVVNKLDTVIELDVPNVITVNNENTITGTLTDNNENRVRNATINYTFTSETDDDLTGTVTTNNNGEFNIIFSPNIVATYNLEVGYDGNTKYESSTATEILTSSKQNTNILLNSIDPTIKVEEKLNITGYLVDADNIPLVDEDVTININNIPVEVTTNSNGKFNTIFTCDTIGNLTINAIYSGNTVYNNSNSNNVSITVQKLDTTTSIYELDSFKANKTTNISGRVTDENNKPRENIPVTIIINHGADTEITYNTTTNNKGVYSYDYTPTRTYDSTVIQVTAESTTNTNSSSINQNISISSDDARLVLTNDDTTRIGQPINISGTLYNLDGEAINDANMIITIEQENNTPKTIETINGAFNTTYTPTGIGTETITITCETTAYGTFTQTITITIEKLVSNISIVTPEAVFYDNQFTITGVVTTTDGETVPDATVNINLDTVEHPVSETVTTNNDGEYTCNLLIESDETETFSDSFNIQVTANGDTIQESSNSTSVTPNKELAKIKTNNLSFSIGSDVILNPKVIKGTDNTFTPEIAVPDATVTATIYDTLDQVVKTQTVTSNQNGILQYNFETLQGGEYYIIYEIQDTKYEQVLPATNIALFITKLEYDTTDYPQNFGTFTTYEVLNEEISLPEFSSGNAVIQVLPTGSENAIASGVTDTNNITLDYDLLSTILAIGTYNILVTLPETDTYQDKTFTLGTIQITGTTIEPVEFTGDINTGSLLTTEKAEIKIASNNLINYMNTNNINLGTFLINNHECTYDNVNNSFCLDATDANLENYDMLEEYTFNLTENNQSYFELIAPVTYYPTYKITMYVDDSGYYSFHLNLVDDNNPYYIDIVPTTSPDGSLLIKNKNDPNQVIRQGTVEIATGFNNRGNTSERLHDYDFELTFNNKTVIVDCSNATQHLKKVLDLSDYEFDYENMYMILSHRDECTVSNIIFNDTVNDDVYLADNWENATSIDATNRTITIPSGNVEVIYNQNVTGDIITTTSSE